MARPAGVLTIHQQPIPARLMIPLPAKRKMANGAPIPPALAAGAPPTAQLAQSTTKPPAHPKAVNGVPALMAAAGAQPPPRKHAPELPLKQPRHPQLQYLLAGLILNQSANHIMDYGVKMTLLTVAIATVLVLV